MEDHVYWKTGMGAWVLINARWYKAALAHRSHDNLKIELSGSAPKNIFDVPDETLGGNERHLGPVSANAMGDYLIMPTSL